MGKGHKRLDRMRANPRDWRITDREAVARACGIRTRKPSGSHVIFEHPAVPQAISVPARRPIKPIYVLKFVARVDAVAGGGNDDNDD